MTEATFTKLRTGTSAALFDVGPVDSVGRSQTWSSGLRRLDSATDCIRYSLRLIFFVCLFISHRNKVTVFSAFMCIYVNIIHAGIINDRRYNSHCVPEIVE